MRILPQASERNENELTGQKKVASDIIKRNSFRQKILLFTGLGLAFMAIVVSLIIIISRRNKNLDDSEGYLVNNGYFYPTNDKYTLYKCSLANCQKCSGTIYNNICYQCFSNSTARYDSNSIIECVPNSPQPQPQSQSVNDPTNVIEVPDTNTVHPTGKPVITPGTDSPTPTPSERLCNDENCLECSETEDICLRCYPGYFIPSDDSTKLNCQKCTIKNCKVCSGPSTNPTCLTCESFAIKSTSDSNLCQIKTGTEAFCLTGDTENNECSSCNIGYVLEEGKCVLDYDIKATFKTRTKNEEVKLIQKFYPQVESMIIDGNKLDKPVKTYTFVTKGEHTVLYKLNLPNDGSLVSLFEGIRNMISISFTEKFETNFITKMNRMFYNCESLKSIDLSYVNTKNVDDMNYMFYQCLELGSIDLSKVRSNNVDDVSYLFENCISLTSIDISNFTNSLIDTTDMFNNLPNSGTITVNKNLKSKVQSKLSTWTVIAK